MNRTALIYFHSQLAGILSETEEGYSFVYSADYLESSNAYSISKTLKLSALPYKNKVLFSFFDGLIPEGWLLDIAFDNWKINYRDRFGLLLACCQNTIGAVSVKEENHEKL